MNKQIKTKFEEFRKATSELTEAILDCEEIEPHSKLSITMLINKLGKFIEDYLEERGIL